jgi:hypothetical protein
MAVQIISSLLYSMRNPIYINEFKIKSFYPLHERVFC